MTSLFRPKIVTPKMPEVPQAPVIDDARAARDDADRRLRRKGRAATVFTSRQGDQAPLQLGTKQLLG